MAARTSAPDVDMPDKKARERAEKKETASEKAGEYVREEIEHVREGKHGARSAKQAIAIGLSKARRAGVKIPPPPGQEASEQTQHGTPSPTRSRATSRALKKEGSAAASHEALSRHARASARERGPAKRKQAARKAAATRSGQAG